MLSFSVLHNPFSNTVTPADIHNLLSFTNLTYSGLIFFFKQADEIAMLIVCLISILEILLDRYHCSPLSVSRQWQAHSFSHKINEHSFQFLPSSRGFLMYHVHPGLVWLKACGYLVQGSWLNPWKQKLCWMGFPDLPPPPPHSPQHFCIHFNFAFTHSHIPGTCLLKMNVFPPFLSTSPPLSWLY